MRLQLELIAVTKKSTVKSAEKKDNRNSRSGYNIAKSYYTKMTFFLEEVIRSKYFFGKDLF